MSNILQSLIQDNKSEKSSKSNKSSTQSPNKVCFKFKNETENFTIDLKKLPDKHLPDDHKIKANVN